MAGVPVTITGIISHAGLEVGGGPMPGGPGGQPGQPPGIWGPPGPWPAPPIYIPVPPPEGGGEPGVPAHPIYIPVYPTHPIVIPTPPESELPPVIWPPVGTVTPPIYYPPEKPPGIWGGGNVPYPTPPIYYPVEPPDGGGGEEPGVPSHPIYLPIYIWGPTDPRPTPPIHTGPGGDIGGPPVIGGGPILPSLPPPMVNPPSGQPGFWGYSIHYQSPVFVPYKGAIGAVVGGGGPDMPPAVPA